MRGISLILASFVVWIIAKGEFKTYADFVTTSAAPTGNSSSPSSSAGTAGAVPSLPAPAASAGLSTGITDFTKGVIKDFVNSINSVNMSDF